MKKILEVCVDSLASALAAAEGGADRLELCSALVVGGLSPDVALFRQIRAQCSLPVRCLMRPRAGDFLYTSWEIDLLCAQIEALKAAGADGFVIGALTPEGQLDRSAMQRLLSACDGKPVTLHRCIDVSRDLAETYRAAAELGVDTVLTSGGAANGGEGAARLGERYGLHTLPETGALSQVQFSPMGDEAALMLDTSGAGLHKRGYRAQGVAAPLRETLAAAMVLLSRYRGRDPLCDPFCGSGTIPIEAALIAKNRAPGLNRTFSAQKWSWLDKKLWMEAADEAMDKEFHGDYEIWGGDLDPAAVELARHNAALAEVDDVVRFDVDDARTFHWGGLSGRVVTNPPYGERLMERLEAEALYRDFGRAWDKFPEGWKLYLLSSHTEFERTFGKKADKKRKLYNGMLKCDLFMYW